MLRRIRHNKLRFDSFDHLFFAFRRFDILFPVPAALLLDNAFQTLNLFQIIFIFFRNRLLLCLFFYQKFRIIAFVGTKFLTIQFYRFIGNFIQKISVVRDHDKRAGKGRKKALQPFHGTDIQMIGWLIQQ